MPTLTFPTLSKAPAVCRFSLVPNTQTFESPLNRTVQTIDLPGARWLFALEYRAISLADARLLKAFFAKLRGRAGRFYLGDYTHKAPAGTALGSGMIKGAGQTGNSLITDNWTANQAALLLPGDYVGINGELKLITEVIAADAFGEATLVFEPPMRTSPPDDTVLVVSNPTCTFMLKDDEQDQVVIDPERRPTVAIEGMEVF